MNGRIYDPTLGRFLQADPHIQAPNNSQNYNRYSYVLNNPMSYTDPSGYFFSKLWDGVKGIFKGIAKIPILNAALQFVACAAGGPAGCAAYAGMSTYAVTGSLKSAVVGAATAGISGGQGFFAAGLIGGLASKVQGGNFGHGFWSAGIGALVGGKIKTGNAYMNVVVSAVIGGTVSKLTGGKFANGAQTWAFSAAMAQDWGNSKLKAETETETVTLSEEQQKEISKKIEVLNTELDKINADGGFLNSDVGAGWYHDNVFALSQEYGVEFGAQMFSTGVGDRMFGGLVHTDFDPSGLSWWKSTYNGRWEGNSVWHTHPLGVNFSLPDIMLFNNPNRQHFSSMYLSGMRPGKPIVPALIMRSRTIRSSTICVDSCNF